MPSLFLLPLSQQCRARLGCSPRSSLSRAHAAALALSCSSPRKGCSGSGTSLPCPTSTPSHHPVSGETDMEPVHNLSSALFPWGMLLKGIVLCARTLVHYRNSWSAHLLKTMGADFSILQCCGPLLGLILCIALICFSLNWLWLIKDVTASHTILNLLNLGTKKCTETLRERAKSLTADASIIRPEKSNYFCYSGKRICSKTA